MSTGYIQRWLKHDLAGERTIKLTDSGGGPITFTLAATAVLADALADLEAQADADATLSGAYTFSFAAATGVTFACDETFTLEFTESMHKACGFSSATGHTGASSYASDQVAGGAWMNLNGKLSWDIPETIGPEKLHEYTHGRHDAFVFPLAQVTNVSMLVPRTTWTAVVDSGPLLSGKVRCHCSSDTSAFSPTNLDGYLDCFPYDPQLGQRELGDGRLVEASFRAVWAS